MNNAAGRSLVFIPTYNERQNAEAMCRGLVALNLDIDILFLDDNSPDGTGQVLDKLAIEFPRVKVIHRSGKLGIGSAHRAGIRYAYEHGYRNLVTMDCDFTHPPHYVPLILSHAEGTDIAIGSRYMSSGSLPGWNMLRKCLTNVGHLLTRVLLGMSYDATGALRLYRLDRIPEAAFDLVSSFGYSFFFESLYILHFNRFKVKEFPIALPARTYGSSKMSYREVFRSVKLLATTFIIARFNPEKYQLGASLPQEAIDRTKVDPQGWEEYWNVKKQSGRVIYDAVASMYRKFIIKPYLNAFITKTFPRGATLLHAGCGGGQVDTDIRKHAQITGLDISVNALNLYLKENSPHCKVVHGSIFEIPAPAGSFDGVYNLGVMEHFTEIEIQQILREFQRVLKPGGKVVLFWPPEYGISVTFFKMFKWVLTTVLRRTNVKLHPDEVSRLQSKRQALGIMHAAGFEQVQYSFGAGDLFTQVVLVASKPGGATQAQSEEMPAAWACNS